MPNTSPSKMETISTDLCPPGSAPQMQTYIAANRKTSITAEQNNTSDLRIYTDRSGYEGNTGAAAVMYSAHQCNPIATLCYHMGPITNYTNVDAKGIGAMLALWLLLSTNSQSFIQIINKRGAQTGQYIQDSFLAMANDLQHSLPRTEKLQMHWISAHSEVISNKKADEEAK
ncbi:hypothetical protein BDQ12DRAFT_722746 [Crucibulum laeve]|uniref:Uncharacterized protein n=1 Tax=Crucibulum laeve TaxID=68775 RepID=A0A5C3M279_9AGAR|nr:hypothetical protein BDQ12DRAFT_722746 [Crucibulum laeve]